MKNKLLINVIILILFFTSLLPAQSQFQQFIGYVNSLGDPVAKQAAVDSFITYARTGGIYFYQLKAGDPSTSSGQSFIQTKKMTLLK